MVPASGLDPELDALPGTGPVVIAFSGGGDSVCLLDQLKALGNTRRLLAVHVDHGLDHGSARRAAKALDLAAAAAVECLVERVSVRRSGSIEANARQARYAALGRHVPAGGCLVTAHHADDQAETMILRLLRGAGPGGLSGIPRRRRFGLGWLVRPLLSWSRAQILAYLEENQLAWISDPANEMLALDRNFIRHEVLPLITTRFPGAVKAVNRSAELNRAALTSLNEIAAQDLARARRDDARLDWSSLAPLDDFRCAEAIRQWCIRSACPPPPGSQLDEFLRQLRTSRPDRQPQLRWEHLVMRCWRNALWLEPVINTHALPWSLPWSGEDAIELPGPSGRFGVQRGGLSPNGAMQLRSGGTGERIRLPGQSMHRPVQQLMAESGIPPWQREHWPRLYRGSQLLALGDRWLDADFKQELAACAAELCWSTELYRPQTPNDPPRCSGYG
ncbi:MAG: tRNA lysidine(34) synthetase TilS [Wenzhouxiangella sp.]